LIATLLTFGFGSPGLSDTVSSAQRILNELGYNAGTVDGSYGVKTKRALKNFYNNNNFLYDEKLDDNEISDLKLAAEKANNASELIV
jgi:peptidoglycan hydrolase-like protein with peptidoglycan-binding domain